MKHAAISVTAVVLLALGCAQAQDIVGDWRGSLKAGGAELRLVLHVTKAADGGLKATLDSVDQGARGIAVSSITLKEHKLTLAVADVAGAYEGTVNADATAITGTWAQGGQTLPLAFQRATAAPAAKPADIVGTWMGALNVNAIQLRLAFHITATETGMAATMDSIDQGAKGIPVTAVTLNGATLTMETKSNGGKFEGKYDATADAIDGTWTQGPASFPLSLKRVKDLSTLEVRRPQNPAKPYPYAEEEVTYENKAAGIKLAGTLTAPRGKGPFPAVLLITGSGPQDRDETLLGHKPFLVLADHLTRKGIVVLRADDRGVAKSGGTYATATSADFATDAEAGLAYLKTRPEVDTRHIGLLGHSEGGVIAPMVAARNSDVAFVVLMAGTGVPGNEIIVAQAMLIAEAAGNPHEVAERIGAEQREVLALVMAEPDNAVVEKKLREKLAGKVPEGQLAMQLKAMTSPWYRYFLGYDPAPALSKVRCPVLAINGEKDTQVPPKLNLPAIQKALEAGGNKNFELVEFPGLNHLFQTAKTGAPSEYGQIEETIAPVALEKMSSWILKQTSAPAAAAK